MPQDERVYRAAARGARGLPDLDDAAAWLTARAAERAPHVVVLSSAQVFEPGVRQPGLATEDRTLPPTTHPVARRWRALETLAHRTLHSPTTTLTIIRPPVVATPDDMGFVSRLLRSRVAVTLPGHNPTLQLVDAEGLERAIARALSDPVAGIVHVPPTLTTSLRAALATHGVRRVPLPRMAQALARRVLVPLGLADPLSHLDYIRYDWTIATRRAPDATEPFGLDVALIDRLGRGLFGVLHDRYWRVDLEGLEHIPTEGPVVLVGVHRGFFPWDAMMTLHGVRSRTGRVPRFLVHPGLLKFPFFFNLFRRLGGLLACREHMDHVLARGGVLGVFPEGVEGAFRLYRDAYRIDRFRRNAFVRAAIRHRAVIVPFVTAGSAEASPILAKIEWDWWRKRTLWPAFPITPTLLPLPIPLPSKWRTRFLPPVDPGTRDDSASVRRVSGDIRTQMQAALTELAAARRSPRQA